MAFPASINTTDLRINKNADPNQSHVIMHLPPTYFKKDHFDIIEQFAKYNNHMTGKLNRGPHTHIIQLSGSPTKNKFIHADIIHDKHLKIYLSYDTPYQYVNLDNDFAYALISLLQDVDNIYKFINGDLTKRAAINHYLKHIYACGQCYVNMYKFDIHPYSSYQDYSDHSFKALSGSWIQYDDYQGVNYIVSMMNYVIKCDQDIDRQVQLLDQEYLDEQTFNDAQTFVDDFDDLIFDFKFSDEMKIQLIRKVINAPTFDEN